MSDISFIYGRKDFHSGVTTFVVNVRCPSCRQNGAFHGMVDGGGQIRDAQFSAAVTGSDGRRGVVQFIYGVRACPNPQCKEPIFVICNGNHAIVRTYPVEQLDFEPTGVPPKILSSFQEAISCHSNSCYVASAIMVRRTLEEICADRGAAGENLKARIAALGSKILVPKELLDAADELRLLGNDAAHLEAKLYEDIGKEEIEAAIDLSKEILKAVYQLSSLVDRLRSLKRS